MNLDYTYGDIHRIITGEDIHDDSPIHVIHYDTRRIIHGDKSLFFAFKGQLRNGDEYIQTAYDLGVRHFVCSAKPTIDLPGASYTIAKDPLEALQKLAAYHRSRFNYPVIAITGSNGKTIVKEWLSELLSHDFNVVKSPKSYNSQLGVAISLLEMSDKADLAIIEAGISRPDEMSRLEQMIRPTFGILTHLGTAHIENFPSKEALKLEKLKLFEDAEWVVVPKSISWESQKRIDVRDEDMRLAETTKFKDSVSLLNLATAIRSARQLGVDESSLKDKIKKLQGLVMRMEQFDGIHNNLIINDTYSLDREALISSLEYQYSIAEGQKRVLIIGLENKDPEKEAMVKEVISSYSPIDLHFVYGKEDFTEEIHDCVILIKGTRNSNMERLANALRLRKHQSYLEIDLEVIRKNIKSYSAQLNSDTKLLCMVKASSYGSDAKKIGAFLKRIGVDYLGVAYADEGVELRESGVDLPILVMNVDTYSFASCIEYDLEPAVFSIEQLESLVKELIGRGISNFPIHIKLETGMHRLGFEEDQIQSLINYLKAQPEVFIKSVYSHLASADDPSNDFTTKQIRAFKELSERIQNEVPYTFIRHLLNSEGIANFPEAQFDMVRLGIGMYGISSNSQFAEKLEPSLKWISSVSQIKKLKKGDAVGYSNRFIAEGPMQSATIPVGYADGFRRMLGNGKGSVYINGHRCPVLGNVCMDMVMVDITSIEVETGDSVEIIGNHITIQEFAELLGTIPYEVLTAFSQRLPRVYIND